MTHPRIREILEDERLSMAERTEKVMLEGLAIEKQALILNMADRIQKSLAVAVQVPNEHLEYIRAWQHRAKEAFHGNIGYVDSFAVHHFHGSMKNRGYSTRDNILIENHFSPVPPYVVLDYEVTTEEERLSMIEDDEVWRRAVMADATRPMAERVERVMRGMPEMSAAQRAIFGKMQGFTRQLKEDEQQLEEETATILRKETKG